MSLDGMPAFFIASVRYGASNSTHRSELVVSGRIAAIEPVPFAATDFSCAHRAEVVSQLAQRNRRRATRGPLCNGRTCSCAAGDGDAECRSCNCRDGGLAFQQAHVNLLIPPHTGLLVASNAPEATNDDRPAPLFRGERLAQADRARQLIEPANKRGLNLLWTARQLDVSGSLSRRSTGSPSRFQSRSPVFRSRFWRICSWGPASVSPAGPSWSSGSSAGAWRSSSCELDGAWLPYGSESA